VKLTNKLNLPSAIVEAVANDGYTRGDADISVTQLIKSPRIVALEKEHAGEIVEDASDRIWSLMGQSIHTILERANRVGIAERRLSITVEGWKISGGMDLFDEDGILTDYKVTSAWSVKAGAKDEWIEQLNVYAEILRANGHPVKGLRVVAILRDWSKLEARRDPAYAQSQVAVFDLTLWDAPKAERFIRDRVTLHKQAQIDLPLCSKEDGWAKSDTFAVMKQGATRETRVYESEEEAHGHAAQNSALYVQKRPGESTRCISYCSVARFCAQFKAIQESKAEAEALAG
jgi:hypothetical protein